MKKILLLLIIISCFKANAQSVIYSENFENGSSFTLNTSDLSGSSAVNTWLINNVYTGGSGSLFCIANFNYSINNVTAQPASFTGGTNSTYMHISSQEAITDNILCGSYQPADGLCNFDETNFTKMSSDINTTGKTNVTLKFWTLIGGSALGFGEVYYSTNGGSSWTLKQGNMNTITSWTQTTLTDPTWDNKATLRFAFRFSNSVSTAATDPGFCIDEIEVTAITPCATTSSTISPITCNSYTSPSGNYTWTSSNTYMDTVPNTAGCDSVITINLTVNNSTNSVDVRTECGPIVWIDGNTYSTDDSTATYTITNGNSAGCDSIVTLNLSISTIDNSVSSSNQSITSNENDASYQWLDCNDNFAIINDATAQTYAATISGSYAVQISKNGCTDTSACTSITVIGIKENILLENVVIYPNPSERFINIDLNNLKDVSIKVYNIEGKIVHQSGKVSNNTYQIDMSSFTGIFYIEINSKDSRKYFPVVVK